MSVFNPTTTGTVHLFLYTSAVAVSSFSIISCNLSTMEAMQPTSPSILAVSMEEKAVVNVGIIYHDDCEGHAIYGMQERPERVTSILHALRLHLPDAAFLQADYAKKEDLCLFHTEEHVESFIQICRKSETTTMEYSIAADTQVMRNTRNAVFRAAGAAIMAVDRIFLPQSDPHHIHSAFCCVRPPGHHAERNKKMGYCFINNAGVAAKYAQLTYGVERVAVLDFDVHHGNGTEDGFNDDPTLFYGSAHEIGSFPFTGVEPEVLMPVDLHELQRVLLGCCDSEDLIPTSSCRLSSSTSNHDTHVSLPVSERDDINRDRNATMSAWIYDELRRYSGVYVACEEQERRIVNREICLGTRSRFDFRRRWRHIVYEMIRFRPGLVIISAGFDGHAADPLSSTQLVEEDYEWATDLVMQACEICGTRSNVAGGCATVRTIDVPLGRGEAGAGTGTRSMVPCLSVLEGGYDSSAMSTSAVRHVQALEKPFMTSYSGCEMYGKRVTGVEECWDGFDSAGNVHADSVASGLGTAGNNIRKSTAVAALPSSSMIDIEIEDDFEDYCPRSGVLTAMPTFSSSLSTTSAAATKLSSSKRQFMDMVTSDNGTENMTSEQHLQYHQQEQEQEHVWGEFEEQTNAYYSAWEEGFLGEVTSSEMNDLLNAIGGAGLGCENERIGDEDTRACLNGGGDAADDDGHDEGEGEANCSKDSDDISTVQILQNMLYQRTDRIGDVRSNQVRGCNDDNSAVEYRSSGGVEGRYWASGCSSSCFEDLGGGCVWGHSGAMFTGAYRNCYPIIEEDEGDDGDGVAEREVEARIIGCSDAMPNISDSLGCNDGKITVHSNAVEGREDIAGGGGGSDEAFAEALDSLLESMGDVAVFEVM